MFGFWQNTTVIILVIPYWTNHCFENHMKDITRNMEKVLFSIWDLTLVIGAADVKHKAIDGQNCE